MPYIKEEILGEQFFDPQYWVKIKGFWYALCNYKKGIDGECPNNINGVCATGMVEIPTHLCHKFDGKNNWKCPCG